MDLFDCMACFVSYILKIAIASLICLGHLLYTYMHRLPIQETLIVTATIAGSEVQTLRLHIIM